MKKTLLYFLLILSHWVLNAQVYPVQVTPQLIPPHSLKLSDYQTTANEKLFVNLLLTDINEVGRRVRLKMKIQGQGLNIETVDFVNGAAPIFLDGGINTRLSNLDVRPYFDLNNLQGITPQQYSETLPEGSYNFCFEVYDYLSGQLFSRQNNCFTVYLLLNDPPFLNLPNTGDLITAQNPQNIVFNWTPRHLNATNVQYEFTLKELWDTGINPQAAFVASPPLYQTTTLANTLLYGPGETQLLEGKTYGWQVRAIVSDGISETSVFRNNGYSEIYYFNYTANCDAPQFILSEAQNSEIVGVTWQTSEHLRYEIQYRKKGFTDEEDWFTNYAYNPETTIRNLEAGTTYELRVGGECTPNQGFSFSQIQEFTTPTEEEEAYYNCGVTPEVEISNQDPLQNIGVNEVFTAGDFPVTVKEVRGSNGVYSGWGYISVPYLADTKIRVEFDGITINSDYQLTEGIVETSYDANWEGISSIDDAIGDIFGDDGDIDRYDASTIEIANVEVDENGNIVLIDETGGQHPIETDTPVIITDASGDQWSVDEEGNVTPIGNEAEGGTPNASNTNGITNTGRVTQISSMDVSVTFTPSGFYGTDKLRSSVSVSNFTNKYETIEQASGGYYNVLYKAISDAPQTEDIITATATLNANKTTNDIIFKTVQGTAIPAEWDGNTATLTLTKRFDFAKDEIIATVKPEDSTANWDIAGKLNVWHLTQQAVNVTLVPINGASIPSDIENKINAIYNTVGVQFNVTTAPSLTVSADIWDIENDNEMLDIGDSNLLANYTAEERAIYQYYKDQRSVTAEMYYVFVLGDDTPTSDPQTEGFMPLKRQYGFVFNPTNTARTIAHELGHGIYGLEHPFVEYGIQEGDTDLLMDYGTGTEFTHMDWQKIHAPGIQLYLFQGDEDGESAIVTNIEGLKEFANADGTFTFISRSGMPITVPSDITEVIFSTGDSTTCPDDPSTPFRILPFGTLTSFKWEGKNYTARWNCSENRFTGYAADGTFYFDPNTNLDTTSAIIGFPAVSSGSIIFKVGKINIEPVQGGEKYRANGDYEDYDFLATRISEVTKFNEVYARFDPDYDTEVKQFILDRIKEQEFDGSIFYENYAYIFIHATQLQKYDVLKGCFKGGVPGELLKYIQKNVLTYIPTGVDGGIYETSQEAAFKLSHEEDADSFNANSLVNLWKEYDLNYYPIVGNAVDNFSLPQNLDAQDIVDLFDTHNINNTPLSNNWDCFWEALKISDKTRIIQEFADAGLIFDGYFDMDSESEHILLKIFTTTTDNADRQTLLDFINNYNYLEYIFDSLDYDSSHSSLFVGEIYNWLKELKPDSFSDSAAKTKLEEFKDFLENQVSYAVIPKTYTTDMYILYGANWFNETDEIKSSFEANLVKESNLIEIRHKIAEKNAWILSNKANFKGDFGPYDPVLIYLDDDRFVEYNEKLVKGSYAMVPAIYLHWLDSSLDSAQNDAALRIGLDMLAIALAPVTFGSSTTLLAIEVTAATIDIIVTANRQELEQSLGKEAVQVWDVTYGLYNLAYLPKAVIGIGQASKALFNFVKNAAESGKISRLILNEKYLNNFLESYASLSREKQVVTLTKIDDLILAIKNEKALNIVSKRILFRALLKVRARCKNIFSTSNRTVDIAVDGSGVPYQPYLVITEGSTSMSLGKVELTADKTLKLVSSERWLPASVTNVTEIGEIANISFIKNGALQVGILKILEDSNQAGQFYLKINSIFIDVLQRDYPSIYSKVASFSDELKKTFLLDFVNATSGELNLLNSNNAELVDVWQKWGNPDNALVKLSNDRISNVDDLLAYKRVYQRTERLITFDDFYTKSISQIKEVIDLKKEGYKKFSVELFEAWNNGYKNNKSIVEMETIYKKYGLDPTKTYPPNEGVWGLLERPRAPKIGERFDRFQARESLGGGYAGYLDTPNAVPTVSARALKENYSEIVENGDDYFYFIFEVKDIPSDLKFEFGEAMAWFGEVGGAIQIKSSKQLHEISGAINILQKWQLVDGKWVKDLHSLIKNKFPEDLHHLLDDASGNLLQKLENLNKEGKLERFIEGFKNNTSALLSFKDNPELIDIWSSVKYLKDKANSIEFLESLSPSREIVFKHVPGEISLQTKSYGYKIQVKGYHQETSEVNINPPIYGNAGMPNPNDPNNPIIVSVGTASNPTSKGKYRISEIRDYINDDMPYTAKIDVEIPVGSGNYFSKKGVDGKNIESGRSSMFPKNWDLDRIAEETAYVRSNINSGSIQNADGTYDFLNSENTFKIKMYLQDLNDYNSNIGSTFPKVD